MADDGDEYINDDDEDISELEDRITDGEEILAEDSADSADYTAQLEEDLPPLPPDVPVYRLRLPYSNETFLAAWPGETLPCKTWVLSVTRHGKDMAQVVGPIQRRGAGSDVARIKRLAVPEDLERMARNNELETGAFAVCREKIEARQLDMKLISVHYLLEDPKILFFFAAESRVDFRELVKDLVGIFKTRIELRQIGVRDEARVVGGLGVCGRTYCCHSVSDKLKPVSIKMAKDQNLSLNSMKISGACGRLLCCLAYEHGFYSEQRKLIPNEGTRLNYDETTWKVIDVNIVTGTVGIAAEDGRQLHLPAVDFEKTDGRWRVREQPGDRDAAR
jgi:cell fate regulator YaaT (PSP1 superfamily)